MKARMLRIGALNDLRSSIADNLDSYRTGSFDHLKADPAFTFEYDVDVDINALAALSTPNGKQYYEVENCRVMYSALRNLSPYVARDERLWSYLSHSVLLDHARLRWTIPSDDEAAIKHIAKHWFARDKRQIERENVGSRLWWMGHLCARIENADPDLALRAFLFRSDVRANLVERPTVSQSVGLFSAIVRRLIQSLEGKKALFERTAFRRLMVSINSVGGYRLLDCLGEPEIEHILDSIIADRLRLQEL